MHKQKKNNFIILIPSYNELINLKKFIYNIKRIGPVIILDDASHDNTSSWLKKNKINFIKNKKNLGYENNLYNGIIKFKKKFSYIITFDADGQHKIGDLKKIIKQNLHTKYDIIICNRIKKNRFFEQIISYFFYIFYGIKDPLSGFKVYSSSIFKKKIIIKNFFLVDIILENIKNKTIKNFQISTNKRKDKSRVGNLLFTNFKLIKILLKIVCYKFLSNH